MGLRFTDKERWQRWQDSRRRLHVLKDKLLRRDAPGLEPALECWIRGTDPRVLVACDSNSPTNHHSLLAPLDAVPDLDALVLQPVGVDLSLGDGWRRLDDAAEALEGVRSVATIGDHLGVGAWAHEEARRRGWRQFVVQHGLLTPFSPPPPPDVELLAWSERDAAYWTEGRPDLAGHAVGSVLLAAAAAEPAGQVSRFERPVFLGQLHGAELPRMAMARSVTAFWRETRCVYRPHPREKDKLSRLQHALWRRMGMEFDDSPRLSLVDRPVVSAFSTGVLEAAARGVPTWVYHLDPPAWLEEMWERYGMARWGGASTNVKIGDGDPAARVARSWLQD